MPQEMGSIEDTTHQEAVSIAMALPKTDTYKNDFFEVEEKEGEIYLVDDHQNRYLLAQSLDDLHPEVTALDVSNQGFKVFPREILAHSQLQILIMENNAIEDLPVAIDQLQQLKYLDVTNNALEVLPSSLGNLQGLEELDLGLNNFRALPTTIGQLKKLKKLHLDYCERLDELPASIGDLEALEELTLEFTLGLKTLPASIGKLENLKKLDIIARHFESLPGTFGQLSSLEELHLSGYIEIAAPIDHLPKNFSKLKKLKQFSMNRVSIPKEAITRLKEKMPWCEIDYPDY